MWTSFPKFRENLTLSKRTICYLTNVFYHSVYQLVHFHAYLSPLGPQGRIELTVWKKSRLQTCQELQQMTTFWEAEWWSLDAVLAYQDHSATAVHCNDKTCSQCGYSHGNLKLCFLNKTFYLVGGSAGRQFPLNEWSLHNPSIHCYRKETLCKPPMKISIMGISFIKILETIHDQTFVSHPILSIQIVFGYTVALSI